MKSVGLGAASMLLGFCLTVPNLATAATSIDFSNSGGTLSATSSGLSLSASTLISVIGLNGAGLITGNLGSVSFFTGALTSGSLAMGGTFKAGGTFLVKGNGTHGIPDDVLFVGTFSGPVTWTLINLAGGTHNYTLTGVLIGIIGEKTVDGVTAQLTLNVGRGLFHDSTFLAGGNTSVSSVPEPSTFAMLLTGSITTAGMLRRKLAAK